MKEQYTFYLGAFFSLPSSAYISSGWSIPFCVLFIFVIAVFGGIFGLAVKDYFTQKPFLKWTEKI